ncbi:long-chain acyl-CoA synthetase [Streptacidiphilus sp. MAP12-33]|uniref:class I adenylate-forming enzyme family protein n=1 Tax=Streptacidiphilus sp. MAP12-33 TaxID=3156266 RepID=UPI003511A007
MPTHGDAAPGPLYRAVRAHALAAPLRPALIHDQATLSYAELVAEADRRAQDRAAADPSDEGGQDRAAAGTVADPTDAGGQERSARRPWTVVHGHDKLDFTLNYLAGSRLGASLVVAQEPGTAQALARTLTAAEDRVAGLRLAAPEALFTSGSSGRPKAVLLDGEQLVVKAGHINAFLGNTPAQTEVLSLPLQHSFGLGRLRCALTAGQSVHLVEPLGSPEELLDVAQRYAYAGLACISSTVKVLLDRYRAALARTAPVIGYLEIGSEPLEPAFRQDLARLLPTTRLGLHYGMTECSRVAMTDLHTPATDTTAGRPMPGVEVSIEAGTSQILVRGTALLRAYADQDGLTEIPAGHWHPTGDVGALTDDGRLVVEGRLSNITKILGRKVSLDLTERTLDRLVPGARTVCVAPELVPGVATLVAVIESGAAELPDRAALHAMLREELPAHQVPRRFLPVPLLPRLPNGKVDRTATLALAGTHGRDGGR